MNKKYMLKYIISFSFAMSVGFAWSQEELPKDSLKVNKLDSIQVKETYGIRVGLDISRPLIQTFQKQD